MVRRGGTHHPLKRQGGRTPCGRLSHLSPLLSPPFSPQFRPRKRSFIMAARSPEAAVPKRPTARSFPAFSGPKSAIPFATALFRLRISLFRHEQCNSGSEQCDRPPETHCPVRDSEFCRLNCTVRRGTVRFAGGIALSRSEQCNSGWELHCPARNSAIRDEGDDALHPCLLESFASLRLCVRRCSVFPAFVLNCAVAHRSLASLCYVSLPY